MPCRKQEFEAALAYIADHPEIWEVILTGGDPFILSPRRIAEITSRLSAIAHVKVVRWHTRVPVTDPERVTDDLVAALQAPGSTTFVAVHANHPREFSPQARRAMARLAEGAIPLVSQSVLLKGVNDDVEILAALMRCFVENRIKPYYLHHPDLAPGTSHFRPGIEEGSGPDARIARTPVWPRHAHLHARHTGRLRQSAAASRSTSKKPRRAIASATLAGCGTTILTLRQAQHEDWIRSSRSVWRNVRITSCRMMFLAS